jgi:hydrogenase maturation factor
MCIGSVALLEEVWDEEGVPVGRVSDGCVVPLLFVPEAAAGDSLLLHLGIPVEVLDDDPC